MSEARRPWREAEIEVVRTQYVPGPGSVACMERIAQLLGRSKLSVSGLVYNRLALAGRRAALGRSGRSGEPRPAAPRRTKTLSAAAQRLLACGMSARAIAALPATPATPAKTSGLTDAEKETARTLFASGLSVAEVAFRLGRDNAATYARLGALRRYRVPPPTPSPADVKPVEPCPAVARRERVVKDDGFTYVVCAECGVEKMAALFVPAQLEQPEPRCRMCLGEIRVNQRRPHRATPPASSAEWARGAPAAGQATSATHRLVLRR